MFAGLALLTGVVCLLAFSGIWGLYRYRRLANAVSRSAAEIQVANELHQHAVTLYASNQRLADFDRPHGMMETSGLNDDQIFDSSRRRMASLTFEEALMGLHWRLQVCKELVVRAPNDLSLLPSDKIQNKRFEAICEKAENIGRLIQQPQDPKHYRRELETQLSDLVDTTRRYATAITESMAGFSEKARGEYRTAIGVAWTCLVVALSLVGILLWLFWALIVQPFRTLLAGSRMVANQAAFGHRISLGTGDELDELAAAMNAMSSKFSMVYNHSEQLRQNLESEVRDRTREVIRNEQLASVGFLAAGVAHEINNPLTTIAWGAESLEGQIGELDESESSVIHRETANFLRSTLKQIQSEAFRCKGITDRLLDFSRMSDVRRESTDLATLVGDVIELVSKVGDFRCKTINTHFTGSTIADVNADQIRQVVLNLVTNALESVDEQGSVNVCVFAENGNAKIIVEDDGCGMTDEVMTHLFEPFFTRRQNGKGTGLGLSITCRIVSQHGGSLTPFSDGEGLGSRLEVSLPLHTETKEALVLPIGAPSQELVA